MSDNPQDHFKKLAQEVEEYKEYSSKPATGLVTLPDVLMWSLGFLLLWGLYQLVSSLVFFKPEPLTTPPPGIAKSKSAVEVFQENIQNFEKRIYQLLGSRFSNKPKR